MLCLLLLMQQCFCAIITGQQPQGWGLLTYDIFHTLRGHHVCRTKYYGVHLGKPDVAATPFKDEPLMVHRSVPLTNTGFAHGLGLCGCCPCFCQ